MSENSDNRKRTLLVGVEKVTNGPGSRILEILVDAKMRHTSGDSTQ